LLETIPQKFLDSQTFEDLQWSLISSDCQPLPPPKINSIQARAKLNFGSIEDIDEDEDSSRTMSLKGYWEVIRDSCNAHWLSSGNLPLSVRPSVPSNWTVVSISVTEDKGTMFVARQRASTEPLIFCVPLKERENACDDDPHLTFDDALTELKEIIRLSDDGTRRAASVRNDDPHERAAWWTERSELDRRMRELLENIEFCWLGGLKVNVFLSLDN
jgi:separase